MKRHLTLQQTRNLYRTLIGISFFTGAGALFFFGFYLGDNVSIAFVILAAPSLASALLMSIHYWERLR